jgi:hypothetical protein
VRLYRGLTRPYDPSLRRGFEGTDFTDCAYTALSYARGRRGVLLVLDVPAAAATKATEELWLGVKAKRLMVWGRFDDYIVAVLEAKELRAAVRRKTLYGRADLESVIEAKLGDRPREELVHPGVPGSAAKRTG